MASRKIMDLTPDLQILFAAFSARMAEAELPFILTCTLRSEKEQEALYARGRLPVARVKQLYMEAGLGYISEEAASREVTWVTNSKHNPDKDGKSHAFDIALCMRGVPHWRVKADVNHNERYDYEEAAIIGKALGLRVGADFSKPDWVHFELAEKVG